jgi:signal transduction histidine kinase
MTGDKTRTDPAGPLDEALTDSPRALMREVAHMLRSPIGSIVMLADTLMEQGDALTASQRRRQLAIIHRAAIGIATTAGELLTLTDMEPGDAGLGAPFSPRALLDTVADLTRPVTEAREAEMRVRGLDGPIVGKEGLVTRAMLSLALRAASRTRGGSLELYAERGARDRVTFGIVAQGVDASPRGGEAELLEIFRPEPDTDSYTLSSEGLGLAAVQRLVHRLGSDLDIDVSKAGEMRVSFGLTDAGEVRPDAGGP